MHLSICIVSSLSPNTYICANEQEQIWLCLHADWTEEGNSKGIEHKSPGIKHKSPLSQRVQASITLCQLYFVLSVSAERQLHVSCRHWYPALSTGLVAGIPLICLVSPVGCTVGCSLVLQWSQGHHHNQRHILSQPRHLRGLSWIDKEKETHTVPYQCQPTYFLSFCLGHGGEHPGLSVWRAPD